MIFPKANSVFKYTSSNLFSSTSETTIICPNCSCGISLSLGLTLNETNKQNVQNQSNTSIPLNGSINLLGNLGNTNINTQVPIENRQGLFSNLSISNNTPSLNQMNSIGEQNNYQVNQPGNSVNFDRLNTEQPDYNMRGTNSRSHEQRQPSLFNNTGFSFNTQPISQSTINAQNNSLINGPTPSLTNNTGSLNIQLPTQGGGLDQRVTPTPPFTFGGQSAQTGGFFSQQANQNGTNFCQLPTTSQLFGQNASESQPRPNTEVGSLSKPYSGGLFGHPISQGLSSQPPSQPSTGSLFTSQQPQNYSSFPWSNGQFLFNNPGTSSSFPVPSNPFTSLTNHIPTNLKTYPSCTIHTRKFSEKLYQTISAKYPNYLDTYEYSPTPITESIANRVENFVLISISAMSNLNNQSAEEIHLYSHMKVAREKNASKNQLIFKDKDKTDTVSSTNELEGADDIYNEKVQN